MLACAAFDLSPEQLGLEEVQSPSQPSSVLLTELEIAQHRSGWSLLWHEDASIAAGEQRVVYDTLECEIIAMALQWKPSAGSLIVLQELALQAIRKHDAMHTKDHHDSNETRITRRHALQAIAQFPIQMYGLTLFSAGKQALPAPEELLPACAAGLTACLELRQYEPDGLFTIHRTLAAYLPALEHFACQSSPSQRGAAHLASQSYLLISMITEHFGKYDQMEAACNLARLYGQIAQDPNLEVAALTRLAVHSAYRNRDNKALETYQEASALPGFARTSPLLRGRVYAGLAGMSACCGQSQEALSFLSKAREVFPQHAENDPSFRFAYCVQSHLALWEGITYKHTTQQSSHHTILDFRRCRVL